MIRLKAKARAADMIDPAILAELDREFLGKLSQSRAMSIEQINDGLRPVWQVDASMRLAARGMIAATGLDGQANSKFKLTESGINHLQRLCSTGLQHEHEHARCDR